MTEKEKTQMRCITSIEYLSDTAELMKSASSLDRFIAEYSQLKIRLKTLWLRHENTDDLTKKTSYRKQMEVMTLYLNILAERARSRFEIAMAEEDEKYAKQLYENLTSELVLTRMTGPYENTLRLHTMNQAAAFITKYSYDSMSAMTAAIDVGRTQEPENDWFTMELAPGSKTEMRICTDFKMLKQFLTIHYNDRENVPTFIDIKGCGNDMKNMVQRICIDNLENIIDY